MERKVAALDGPVAPVVAGKGETVVWGYRRFDITKGVYATASVKASLETIESIGAEAIPGTDQVVKIATLDGNGLTRTSPETFGCGGRLEQ